MFLDAPGMVLEQTMMFESRTTQSGGVLGVLVESRRLPFSFQYDLHSAGLEPNAAAKWSANLQGGLSIRSGWVMSASGRKIKNSPIIAQKGGGCPCGHPLPFERFGVESVAASARSSPR